MELQSLFLWIFFLSGIEGTYFHGVELNATQRASTCRVGWTRYQDSCYLFVSQEKEDWAEAHYHCGVLHGYLADILDADESTFVKTELQRRHASGCFYIGATDVELDGQWLWTNTDDPVLYTDWGNGEPNGDIAENCICLHDNHQFRWVDVKCNRDFSFICKMRLTEPGPDVIG
ncbi:perlucin-like protein isoform X1 [Argopecten irradians]|uniref:perlucin-like protein isoform X1 n=1 Tax=Argopecten irradians TaxID=31199 RepID=UPI0037102733